jgi:plastocyanin
VEALLGLRPLMGRRLLPLAFVLGLAAAACAEPPSAHIGFGSGTAFVPQVADAQDDVGLYPSVAVNADGVPYVAYFGLPEQLAEGQVAIPRPVGAPSVPSVLLADVNDGIWTRGAVAMEKAIPSVNIAFGPAEVPQVKSMKPENVNGTSIAIDGNGGLHVAWVSNTGVWYAHNMDGTSFTASQVEKARIDQRGPIGQPSIAVDAQGAPWIAYTRTTARGQDVVVATQNGSSWSTDVVATVPLQAGGSQPGRTAIAATSDGRPVVVFSDASRIQAAASDPENGWVQWDVESGAAGAGVSLAADADGTLHAAYYAGDEIHVATSKDGASWQTASVASVGSGDNVDGRATGVGVDDQGTTYVTWYDPATDDVHLASGDGSSFSPVQTSGTAGGDLPSLAVGPAGEVYLAWYDQTEQNLMLGAYGDVRGLEFAVKSPTPTGAQPTAQPTGGGTEQCTTAENGELTVTAQGIAFDTACIQIPAGEKVTIHFDNKDAGTLHNVAVFPSEQDLTNPMFRGDTVTGPDTIDYEVGPFDAGDYYFHCDVHPSMNGTFRVVSGGGGGGGNGGGGGGGKVNPTTSVTASGLAFDTNQIDLTAGKETKLTFDNQDAGTPHNIAIYPSESQISPNQALFQGEVVTGPTKVTYTIPALDAGTYYFHCDVHPTMNGTVVVS